jgi:hypothetical protein
LDCVASQAALYVHAIAMLQEREAVVAGGLAQRPADQSLLDERAGLRRSLHLFQARLRRTEQAAEAVAAAR